MHKVIVISTLIFSTLTADNKLETQLQELQKEEKLLTQQLAKVNHDIAKVKEKKKKPLKVKVTPKKEKQKVKDEQQQQIIIYYPFTNYGYSNYSNYSYNTSCNRAQHNHHIKNTHPNIRTNITRMQTSR